MSDLKLKKVIIRNWMSIREAEVEFPEKGLVLVIGNNIASGGKLESVGAGKTGIGEAISRALVGVDGRYSTLGHYSYQGKGNTLVDLSVDLMGEPLNVKMGFKCSEMSSTGEALRFKYGDQEPVERGKPLETRQELQSILGITPELAQCSVFIDGDRLRFNRQSERQAVNLLMTALRQPSWDVYQKRASGVLNDAKSKLETAIGALQAVKDSISDHKASVGEAEDALKAERERVATAEEVSKVRVQTLERQIATETKAVEVLEARQKAIKKRMKELEGQSAVQFRDLEVDKAGVQTKISEARVKRTELIEKRAEYRSSLNSAQAALNEMQAEPEKCPTCGKKWDKEHSADEVKTQEKKVAAAKSAYDKFSPQVETVDKNISDREAEIRGIESKIKSLRSPQEMSDLSYEYEQNANQAITTNQDISDIRLSLQQALRGPDKSGITSKTAILEERRAQAEKAKASLEDASSKLVEAEALVKVSQYWYDAFGPTGIPNMIISEAIGPMNEVARRISMLMTGGTIEVAYGTSRELAKGGLSSELVINVKNKIGSSRVEGSSKGESGLTNLIIAETLSEVGSVSNRIGFRWYDEVLNSQDQVVRRSILDYLKSVAHRLGILIFVVDHHSEASSFADYVLVAEKTEKGTAFFWD